MTLKTARQIAKEMVSLANEAKEKSGEDGVFVEFPKMAILEIGQGKRYTARLEKDLATEFKALSITAVQNSDGYGVFSNGDVPVMSYEDAKKIVAADE